MSMRTIIKLGLGFAAVVVGGYLIHTYWESSSGDVGQKPSRIDPKSTMKKANSNVIDEQDAGVRDMCTFAMFNKVKAKLKFMCGRPGCIQIPMMNCEHYFCRCLFRRLLTSSANLALPIKKFRCACLGNIDERLAIQELQSMKPDDEGYQKLSAKLGQDSSAKFVCRICLETIIIEGGVTLECDHRFCSGCFRDYMANLIAEAKVKALFCPEGCKDEIPEATIQAHLPVEAKERLDEHRLRQLDAKNGEVPVTCVKCEMIQLVDPAIADEFLQCLKCREQIQLKIEEQKIDLEGMKQCPNCKEAVIKEGGCNFMRCQWLNCNSSFCYLCLSLLTAEEHYSHYERGGPFGNECANFKPV